MVHSVAILVLPELAQGRLKELDLLAEMKKKSLRAKNSSRFHYLQFMQENIIFTLFSMAFDKKSLSSIHFRRILKNVNREDASMFEVFS